MRAEQRLVQSPQMIQAMQVLQLPLMELKDQIEQELQENVFLERKDEADRPDPGAAAADAQPAETPYEDRLQREFATEIEQLESRNDSSWRNRSGSGAGGEEEDKKLEALANTPGRATSLADHLMTQVRTQEKDEALIRVIEHVVFSLDEDGRLADSPEQVAQQLLAPIPLAEEAVQVVRDLEPVGVGARDLRDCLLMQLDHLTYVPALTRRLVEEHLDDLAMNKLPKIAKESGATIDAIKEAWEFLKLHCNPHPGAEFGAGPASGVVPDVVVEEVDGRFEVKSRSAASTAACSRRPSTTRRSTSTCAARSTPPSGSSRRCTSGRTPSSASPPRWCAARRASCATACSTSSR
jgi:RNA polymerase sigma-54 factor